MEATAIDNSEKGARHGEGSSCEKGRRLHTRRLQPSIPRVVCGSPAVTSLNASFICARCTLKKTSELNVFK